MPTREQLIAAFRAGDSYEDLAEHFHIPPGQAFMIVTGLPADGSDTPGPELLAAKQEFLPGGGTQHLANPPAEVPTEDESVRAWIKRRVAADEPLRRAALARTAEPPPVERRSGVDDTDDVLDLLGRDHNQVKYLQEQLEAIPTIEKGSSPEQQQRRVSILDMMRVRLSRHETAEEEYFWPAVRESVPGGEELAAQAEQQEQQGKDLLQALEGLAGDDERFDELVEQLTAALRKHVAFEDMVFAKARAAMPDEQRAELGRRYAAAEAAAPTRPHPNAPSGSKVAAAAAAPLDRARDALGERPAQRKGKAENEA